MKKFAFLICFDTRSCGWMSSISKISSHLKGHYDESISIAFRTQKDPSVTDYVCIEPPFFSFFPHKDYPMTIAMYQVKREQNHINAHTWGPYSVNITDATTPNKVLVSIIDFKGGTPLAPVEPVPEVVLPEEAGVVGEEAGGLLPEVEEEPVVLEVEVVVAFAKANAFDWKSENVMLAVGLIAPTIPL